MSDEEWVKEATGDDAMVAELLLRFKQVKPGEPPAMTCTRALSVEWTVRQRRSRAVMVDNKKQAPRASPTTPLSWSGATSVSGGGGCGGTGGSAVDGGHEEESSCPSPLRALPPKRSNVARSKVMGTSETASSTKRSRRKKTLAELKEEENLLQNERRQLKRELATLRLNLEKARATNEKLKRMKLQLLPPPAAESASIVKYDLATSDQLQQKTASTEHVPATSAPVVAGSCSATNVSSEEEEVTASKFLLPDLNLPIEETANPDIMCGVS